MTLTSPPFPLYSIDVIPIMNSFVRVSKANDKLDYEMAINHASDAIDMLKRSYLFYALDNRAHAYLKKGQYEAAIQDAQEMIAIAPYLATGYLILIHVFTLQGKPKRAIEIYKEALQNIKVSSLSDNDNKNEDDRSSNIIQDLLEGKKRAMEQNRKRIDFVSILPQELSDAIFEKLDQKSKIACWSVSKKWHETVLMKSSATWSTIVIADSGFQDESIVKEITNQVPHFATHVHHLTLDTEKEKLHSRYLNGINNGHINNIRSLRLQKLTLRKIPTMLLNSLVTTGIPGLGNGLTHLELDFMKTDLPHYDIIHPHTILFAASHLQRLAYRTPLELPVMRETEKLYNFKHHHLIELDILTLGATRAAITPILNGCQQLRCLRLSTCKEDISDVLESKCPYLEILMLNYHIRFQIFHYTEDDTFIRMKKIQWKKITEHRTKSNTSGLAYHNSNGLKELYVCLDTIKDSVVSQHNTVPSLIYNNADTLETLFLYDNRPGTDEPSPPFHYPKPILKMANLNSITMKLRTNHPLGMLLLQSVPAFPILTTLSLTAEQDFNSTVDMLIALQRPLQSLSLPVFRKYGNHPDDRNKELIRLFNYYTTLLSSDAPRATTTPGLESISITDYSSNLTDDVIEALSEIRTIKKVDICSRSSHITVQGLNSIFKKLSKTLTYVGFGELPCIQDKTMGAVIQDIQKCHRLTHIYLYRIHRLYNYSVYILLDSAKYIKELTFKGCTSISRFDQSTLEYYAKLKGINTEIRIYH